MYFALFDSRMSPATTPIPQRLLVVIDVRVFLGAELWTCLDSLFRHEMSPQASL